MPKDTSFSKYKLSTRLNTPIKYKSLKQMHKSLTNSFHPYLNLARISIKPRKKLCDFTGLPCDYTCPRTSLRFFDISVYKYMGDLTPELSERFYYNKMYASSMNRKY